MPETSVPHVLMAVVSSWQCRRQWRQCGADLAECVSSPGAAGERTVGLRPPSPGQLNSWRPSDLQRLPNKCMALSGLEFNRCLAAGNSPQYPFPYSNCSCVLINSSRDTCHIKRVSQTNQKADQLCTVIYIEIVGKLNPFFHKSLSINQFWSNAAGCRVL